ncbi:hypothetical protein SAPIO_CDS2314 [Scedosporium apiospermum]|uniref:Uncharacterized protein n=1 Tax=Pseudallescheria apiosperma TaxID=563466 RepID=A0A084GC82_PSEDA|nr:uncharacterized protein SAPIO_CDS2314 [Scedosporium apiospermum]KEZ44944.1 hypothetical protein SAPIO_CDS2314 [Scedosporium apiospermum]
MASLKRIFMGGLPPADFVAPHGPSRKGGSRPLLPPPTDTDDVPRATHPWEAYDNLLAIWSAVLALDATCLTVIPLGTHRLHMFSYECARDLTYFPYVSPNPRSLRTFADEGECSGTVERKIASVTNTTAPFERKVRQEARYMIDYKTLEQMHPTDPDDPKGHTQGKRDDLGPGA